MFTAFIRTIIMYFFVVLTLRLQGKRQIGELEASELVVTIVISEVAALPIQDTSQPLINSLVSIFLLVILEVLISFGAYKSFALRKIFFGTPSVFYEKGKINESEMEKHRFNLHDLMECVRNTGATNLSEVDFVIMETNGNVSVIPTPQKRSLTPEDVGISPSASALSYVIVDNGCINSHNLKTLGFDENWLRKQLSLKKVSGLADIFCMTATKDGDVIIIPNNKRRKNR
ncbi:MAG: DUF421 domain-containing protein [Clostridia bacterium]|nr:DUF421 domain-containing protein [Clostridia bacterium]